MPLTDREIRALKPGARPFKMGDARGLYLEVTPAGGKLWRMKYRIHGKEKRVALGAYPDVSLAEARNKCDDARRLLAAGGDPSAAKQVKKAVAREAADNSFEVVAREWHHLKSKDWSAGNARKLIRMLELHAFPKLGKRPIVELRAPEILAIVRPLEKRSTLELAHTVLQTCGRVIRYAIATGRAEVDFTPGLRGAIESVKVKHRPALTDPAEVGELLRAIQGYSGTVEVHAALRLLPMLFCRPGELRCAKWSEFDLAAGIWSIPAERMKMRRAHIVPLSSQAIDILARLQPITGRGEYVLPGRGGNRPMSDMTVNAALRRLGYDTSEQVTAHGFRATARTLLHEVLRFDPAVIEHQLAHRVPDALGAAYNRTQFLDERQAMMQQWADYLDELRANVQRRAA